MKRKLFCLIFVLICLTTFCFSAAAGGNTLRGGSEVVAVPGKTVLFPIYMDSADPIMACKLYVTCDTSVFSAIPKEGEKGYQVEKGDVTRAGNIFASAYGNAGWQVYWFHTKNVTANGVFCYLPLQVADNAELGTYAIKVSYSVPNTCDQDGNDVAFTCKDGSIKLVSTEPTIYTDSLDVISGQMVDVPIQIRNNPGVTSLLLKFTERSWLRVVTDDEGKPIISLAEPYANGTPEYHERTPGKWEFLWYSTEPVTVDGPVFTVRVQMVSMDRSTVDFELSYDEENTLTVGDKTQSFLMKAGMLTVEKWPISKASFSDGILHVQTEVGFNKNDLLIFAAVYDQHGKQRATYSIDPTKTNNQISIEKENTDTVSIYAMTANGMVPVMEPVIVN